MYLFILLSTLGRDLRGNSFRCDCKIKWLVDWMEKTNTSVPAIYCASPFEFQGRRIHDLTPRDFNCISAGKALSATLSTWYLRSATDICNSVKYMYSTWSKVCGHPLQIPGSLIQLKTPYIYTAEYCRDDVGQHGNLHYPGSLEKKPL